MTKLVYIIIWGLLLEACNSNNNSSTPVTETFTSKQVDGRWTTDQATAEELKGMKNTIENFTLLNKKKFENLKAYQEFGDLMQMHSDRVTNYCGLDPATKNLLCKKLDDIKTEVAILKGDDMQKSKEALGRINVVLAQIDSSFNYSN